MAIDLSAPHPQFRTRDGHKATVDFKLESRVDHFEYLGGIVVGPGGLRESCMWSREGYARYCGEGQSDNDIVGYWEDRWGEAEKAASEMELRKLFHEWVNSIPGLLSVPTGKSLG
jgi:hypothetical protein